MATFLTFRRLIALLALIPVYARASVHNLTYGNQIVTHVGTSHVYDPNDSQYATLTRAWDEFLQKTAHQPRCVIVEQAHITPLHTSSLKESIEQHGDYGAALYLAQQQDIPVIAGDPLLRKAFQLLASAGEFDPEHVHYAHFAQSLEFYNRLKEANRTPSSTATDYTQERIKAVFPEVSLDSMIKLHETLTNRVFNPYDHNFYRYITFCPPPFSLRGIFFYQFAALKELRKIMIAYHLKRDITTIAIIKEQLMAGKHIFIVYGQYHQPFHIQGIQKIVAGITE